MLKTMIHGRRALLLPVGRASSLLALPRIGANYSKLFSTSILSPTTQFPYAYECSLFGDIETDKLYVEKSIKNGCTTVLTKSNDQSHEIYELMFDISVSCVLCSALLRDKLQTRCYIYSATKMKHLTNPTSIHYFSSCFTF